MNPREFQLPYALKASIFLIGIYALFAILSIVQSIIVPLIFAIIISIVLHPAVNFFERKKIKRIFAIIITALLAFSVIVAIGALLISQASKFTDSWPLLVEKLTELLHNTIAWASGYFYIDDKSIYDWIENNKSEIISNSSAAIGHTLVNLGNMLFAIFLIPVYIFLILHYEPIILEFIHRLFNSSHQSNVGKIISQIKTVIQRYLIGLIIETVIVIILNTSALFILGIEYAILIGVIGGLLNLIPYIGGLVAVALPMMIALATKSSAWYALYILGIYYVIQLIDNNYIVPKIVASKVKINALFSIIVVIAGNALWGIPGMFLSIPILAIVKLIFDHIESMKPWGFLLGDTMPGILKIKPIFKANKK